MHQDDVTPPRIKKPREESKSQDRSPGQSETSDGTKCLPQVRHFGADQVRTSVPHAGSARQPAPEYPPNLFRADNLPGRYVAGEGRAFGVDIAIADKNPMVLAGLAALLEGDKRFNLLFMASDGERFLEKMSHLPARMAIIGWDLPLLHGRDVLLALSKRPDAPKVVVYSGTKDPMAPSETLRLGGAGFVSKLSPPERLLEVFAAVAAGDMVFPFVDIQKIRSDPFAALTHRERDLLAALERGHSNAQLAREFGISINTIKFHLRNLFGKLEVRNRTQAICHYLEMKR